MYLGETNRLYVNQGDLHFVRGSADFATLDGSPTVDVDWADLDNNGWLDLVVTNWGAPVHVYLQTDGRFERVVLGDLGRHMGYGSGAAVADYDNDGDLDLIVGHWPNHPGPEEENHLYRNDGPVGNWLRLDLRGTVSNRSAIGARIEVEVLEDGRRRTMTREIRSQESWRGQNELTAHFGLGAAMAAGSITVHWPSGRVQRIGETEANQRVALTEPN